jgi:hypothetical protein
MGPMHGAMHQLLLLFGHGDRGVLAASGKGWSAIRSAVLTNAPHCVAVPVLGASAPGHEGDVPGQP